MIKESTGFGLLTYDLQVTICLTILFIALKLSGLISYSWAVVVFPLYLPTLLMILGFILFCIFEVVKNIIVDYGSKLLSKLKEYK